jgi:hypothetical protein
VPGKAKNETRVVGNELQTDLREAAGRVCRPEEILGAIGLTIWGRLASYRVCVTSVFRLLFGVGKVNSPVLGC